MNQTTESITCPGCARSYKWKPELAGRKAKCKCGQSVRFPEENPAAGASLEVPVVEPAGEYDMTEPVQRHAAPVEQAPPEPTARCRGCQAPMPEGGVLCTSCGMNQQTGKTISTKVKGPGMEAGDVARVAGRVVLSMVVGGIASLLGAGLWLVIMLVTGYAIGIVAWVIGLGIGGLMRLINREGGTFSGVAAASFALLAIVLPKGILALILMAAGEGLSGLFSPFDALWIFLAVSSAYKLARGDAAQT
jgi:hypothetical protein